MLVYDYRTKDSNISVSVDSGNPEVVRITRNDDTWHLQTGEAKDVSRALDDAVHMAENANFAIKQVIRNGIVKEGPG